MSAADLILKFSRPVTVVRYGTGGYVNGKYVAGATEPPFVVPMSVQPLNGRERLDLPEGQRTKTILKAYSATEIFTTQQDGSKKTDELSFGGKTYEVMKVEHWYSSHNNIDPYWKLIIAEKNPQ